MAAPGRAQRVEQARLPVRAEVLVEAHRLYLEEADAAHRHADVVIAEGEFEE